MKIRKEVFLGLLAEEKAVIDRLNRAKIITVVETEKGLITGRWGTNKSTLKKALEEA